MGHKQDSFTKVFRLILVQTIAGCKSGKRRSFQEKTGGVLGKMTERGSRDFLERKDWEKDRFSIARNGFLSTIQTKIFLIPCHNTILCFYSRILFKLLLITRTSRTAGLCLFHPSLRALSSTWPGFPELFYITQQFFVENPVFSCGKPGFFHISF